MARWTWWPGDALASLTPLDEFSADSTVHVPELQVLAGLDEAEIRARLAAGNQCYVSRSNCRIYA
jgi:hypothetical protein